MTEAGTALRLSAAQLDTYQRDGYLVVEDLLTAGEVQALGQRLREYTHGGRSTDRLRLQVEPRVQRGELSVDHPGD
ncbi:MAG: phytanoyl-CoA dioxygenase family protein, partial [Candidatus Latescibacterota bacterium]